ncbi:hypothetical protein BX616_009048 [Lobosporangium transversale]|nr:hypothetical protein BX616_009048 [Lobosporangium transversale]
MSTPSGNLLYHRQIPPQGTPTSSPERQLYQSLSNASSFDQLPPAMNACGLTPAPSDDHTDMIAHNADITLEEDEHHQDDHQSNQRQAHQHQHPYLLYRHSPQNISRPSTPPVSPAVVVLPPTHSGTAPSSPSVLSSTTTHSDNSLSSSGPLSSVASTSYSYHSETHRNHLHSPFSLFSHGSSSGSQSADHLFSSSKTLRIELNQTEVVLKPGQPTVMEGVVYLSLHKNTKVKTLQLEFSGRSSVTWVDELPDTLPGTITTTHGKVEYKLIATLTKPGLTFHTTTATTPVTILRRNPPLPLRSYQRGGRAVSSPDDKVKYRISMPQVRVPHNTKVPLQVSITAPTMRTHVQVLQVGLWERVVYRSEGRKRVDMRLVKIQKSEGWERPSDHETEAWNWNKVLLFDMPHMGSEFNQCNPSADIGLMKIGHILRFSILGTEGTKRFRVENEIEVKVLAFEDEYQLDPEEENEGSDSELPSYLSSFSTPRVSFDSEREMDPADDLRSMIQRIHLPTYAESEEDANSRATSRNVSRDTSRAPSRSTSPERSLSSSNPLHALHGLLHHHHHHHHHHHSHSSHYHNQSLPHSPLSVGHSPVPSTTPISPSPLRATEPACVNVASENARGLEVPVTDELALPPPLRSSFSTDGPLQPPSQFSDTENGSSDDPNLVLSSSSQAPKNT